MAVFIGGSLDGQRRDIPGAREYVVPCKEGPIVRSSADVFRPERTWLEFYRRTRTVYVDGADHANEFDRERLSHVEMTFHRREPK